MFREAFWQSGKCNKCGNYCKKCICS